MKKLVYFLLVFPIVLIGQTTTENYVHSINYNVAVTNGNQATTPDAGKIETITYVDGLGRPIQSIDHNGGGSYQDIITVMQYDHLGRQTKQYLPYADPNQIIANTTLDMSDNGIVISNLDSYYLTKYPSDLNTTDPNPYQEVRYELSPQSRELETGAPGEAWRLDPTSDADHTVKMEYSANAGNEVPLFSVSLDANYVPTLVDNGQYYPAASLTKVITKDENWNPSSGNNNTAVQYTDKYGRVVLKRTYNEGVAHDTHYVFDIYGNLSFVIPPSVDVSDGISALELSNYCYQYQYDYRNRPVEKQLPGKAREYLVYDALDRPVLTQDGNLKANNQWLFTKYDDLGRVAYTGIYNTVQTRLELVTAMSGLSVYNEASSTAISIGGTSVYYTNNVFPNDETNMDLLTISYYDSYVDLPTGFSVPTDIFSQNVANDVSGLQTISKTKVLNTSDWISTVMAYDDKGRNHYTYSVNEFLDTTDEFSAKLDFIGNTEYSLSVHIKGSNSPLSTWDYYTYDHRNRLLTHLQDFNGSGLELIADNTYDELGQLIKKKVGGELFASGLTGGVRVNVSATGRIEKDDPGNNDAWNAGIATIGKIMIDGGLQFTVVDTARVFMIGLNDINTTHGPGDIDYAFHVRTLSGEHKYRVKIGSNYPTGYLDYQIGDILAVEREGDDIKFIQNGIVVHTEPTGGVNPPLIGDVSFYTHDAAIEGLQFYATNIDKVLQEVDYTYNIRGWLKEINPIEDLGDFSNTDLWSFNINYTGIEGLAAGAVPLYNGNIAQTIWQTSNDDVKRSYTYTYDNLSRITKANSSSGPTLDTNEDYGLWSVSYDMVGNIQGLFRNGNVGTGRKRWDELVYQYDGNRLINVADNATGSGASEGFNDGNDHTVFGGVDDFTYDINGNLITDANKGITTIEYNHLNLPTKVVFNNNDIGSGVEETIIYTYSASGIKLAKRVIDSSNLIDLTTEYSSGFKYTDGTLEFLNQPEGYIHPVSLLGGGIEYQYVFQYKDHLGNIRLSYSDSNNDGAVAITEIVEESNYYPFGLEQKGYNNVISGGNSIAQNWKFGGKEFNNQLGINWYDISARNYDPSIGRWMNIDPLADQMRRHSPYNFAFDNPVFYIDPDGMAPIASIDPPKWLIKVYNKLKSWQTQGSALTTRTSNAMNEFTQPLRNDIQMMSNTVTAVSKAYQNAEGGAFETTKDLYTIQGSMGGQGVGFSTGNFGGVSNKVAKNIINSTDNAASAGASGRLQAEVASIADDLQATGSSPATVVGAELDGVSSIATSGSPPSEIAPVLQKAADDLGGIGNKTTSGNTVGCCGEFRAANEVLLKRPNALPSQVKFTDAIRPRTGEIIPPCENCTSVFSHLER
ncbi:DUF6443 domain-containing protein [Gilvibacter sediminis]|uniref:DUF6443 domain-containing protein n=1 Tax=Gilvibacter sediminis TaxID=379071 RepID=UPI00234FF362|nr:DUF6443 domain-containing protein [Gilvibacter sediminis]MDC7996893.1 DUF6443 domain-containing protein [Gilvibacter sediminis]